MLIVTFLLNYICDRDVILNIISNPVVSCNYDNCLRSGLFDLSPDSIQMKIQDKTELIIFIPF